MPPAEPDRPDIPDVPNVSDVPGVRSVPGVPGSPRAPDAPSASHGGPPEVLVLGAADVRRLLVPDDARELVREALQLLARGQALQPLRTPHVLPDGRGLLGIMPAWLGGRFDAPGAKLVTVHPGNAARGLDAHQGPVVLFDGGSGCPLAFVDGSELTALRTAAASALATEVLARKDARVLALVGAGVQATAHLPALLAVRAFEEVRVVARSRASADAFARAAATQRTALHAVDAAAEVPVRVRACDSVADAVAGADVICTLTASATPVLRGEWIEHGAHVNAVGACTPGARELDGQAMARARLFTDRIESLVAESGDWLLAREEGALDAGVHAMEQVTELGDVLIGKAIGREHERQITVYDALGLGVFDVAAAHHLFELARKQDVGVWVPFGEARHAGS